MKTINITEEAKIAMGSSVHYMRQKLQVLLGNVEVQALKGASVDEIKKVVFDKVRDMDDALSRLGEIKNVDSVKVTKGGIIDLNSIPSPFIGE